MLRAHISERLLAHFMPGERAAAVVGDLLEVHAAPLAFWLSVAQTIWALSWRFQLGFVLAFVAETYCMVAVNTWAASPPHGMDAKARYSAWCCILFATGAMFSLIRFGIRRPISQLSTTLALIAGLDVFFWWMPFVRPASATAALFVLFIYARTSQGRIALRHFLGAMIAAPAPLITAVYLLPSAAKLQCGRGGCSLNEHPILILLPIAFLLSTGIVAIVLGRRREGRALLA